MPADSSVYSDANCNRRQVWQFCINESLAKQPKSLLLENLNATLDGLESK